jgi:hypothetical protein
VATEERISRHRDTLPRIVVVVVVIIFIIIRIEPRAPEIQYFPEPDESSPYPLTYFLKIYFIIILPSMPRSSK